MKLKDITAFFEKLAPLTYQESYDNSGLQVGDYKAEVTGALVTLDVTEAVIDEAIDEKINLVIAHHPVIFGGLKSITGKTMTERIIRKAIQNDISIYAAHTNLDVIRQGVNGMICDRIGLENRKILDPIKDRLKKLVVFVPEADADKVREALMENGAGKIGGYDYCSYNLNGTGTFRGGEGTDPFVGKPGEIHREAEVRIETIFPEHEKGRLITAMIAAHPYEEVAYDIYPLENKFHEVGMGMIGDLKSSMEEEAFLVKLKSDFNPGVVRHTEFTGKKVKRVAVCGGAGSFLLRSAIAAKADVFVSADFKYHQFFDADGKLMIADIGHFESEQFTRELIYDLLIKNFPKFAVRLSKVNTNPIKYF